MRALYYETHVSKHACFRNPSSLVTLLETIFCWFVGQLRTPIGETVKHFCCTSCQARHYEALKGLIRPLEALLPYKALKGRLP